MITFPNCKINLGLHITRKREDGYHDLETVFYPIHKLHDALEILPVDTTTRQHNPGADPIALGMSGLTVEGPTDNNLCRKAYHLLKKDFPQLPAVQMHLHKNIPMGAGLGGGSADGAFTLKLLNDKFHLGLTIQQLIDYALQIGSDCPFFIVNRPCFARGRGEIMEELPLTLAGYSIVIVNPGIHVSTARAFSQVQPHPMQHNLKDLLLQPVETWKQQVTNDFEPTVISDHPVIGDIKSKLYKAGAAYAAMSGSGSTVYGIFISSGMSGATLFPGFLEYHLPLA